MVEAQDAYSRQHSDQAIRGIVDQVFSTLPTHVPRDKVTPYRKEVEHQLASAARQARRSGAVDLYLPVELMHGAPVTASFIVSEGSLGSVADIEPEMILSYLATGRDDNRAVTVDGAIDVRIERTALPDQSQEVEHGSRRVDYVISVPAETDRWVVVAFSTLGGGDPDGAVAAVLRIGPLRWLIAELIPFGCLAIGAAITWLRPDYALAGLMIGVITAPVLGFLYLYKTLGASAWWMLPLGASVPWIFYPPSAVKIHGTRASGAAAGRAAGPPAGTRRPRC